MSSTANCTSHHAMFLATAMAVSGTVIILAIRIQKSTQHFLVNSSPHPLPRSCLSLGGKKDKKKKKVQFAENVVDPIGSGEEYRRKQRMVGRAEKEGSTLFLKKGGGERRQELAGNKMALYNGILRDRVHHRVAYSC